MTKAAAEPKEDSFLLFLEKVQHWFENNWKTLLAIIAIVSAGFIYSGYREDSAKQQQDEWWDKEGKLSTIEEKEEYVKKYTEANARRLVYLNVARESLDKGLFEKTKEHAGQFIANYPKDEFLSLAYLLRAYANEELGKTEEAISDYEKSSKFNDGSGMIAKNSLERLKDK